MKYLLLLAVIAVVLWMMGARRRSPPKPPPQAGRRGGPQPMLACAHCGVHLPQAEAVSDAAGRAFCSEAHRVAGPR